MPSNFTYDDSVLGKTDLDDYFIKDAWIIDRYSGSGLFTTGQNATGGLGLGDITTRTSHTQVGRLENWNQISAAKDGVGVQAYHTAAVKTDGTLWIWGNNANGQLGDNSIIPKSSPVQIGSLTTWKLISTGGDHTLAISTSGTLWSWGRNSSGQLGQNDLVHRSSPVQVGSLTDWKFISTSTTSSMAIRNNGTLWTWGENSQGELASGNTNLRSSPVQVGTLTDWKFVSESIASSIFAIKTDGTLWAWGRNYLYGQLGLNFTSTTVTSNTQVGTMTNWKQISGGHQHTAAVKTDGTLWTWGRGTTGQLGQNNLTHRSSPVQVGTLTNWKMVVAGRYWTSSVKTDGTLWSWGNITSATGGVSGSSPIQVGTLTNWKFVSAGEYYSAVLTHPNI